jgi:uncharacterized protein YgbK (DUF1537 family)
MTFWSIVADDLTGALDTALQFHKGRWSCVVSTRPGIWPTPKQGPAAIALTTETRHLDATAAETRTRAAIHAVWAEEDDENCRLYKKTDSLLRGNIAAEIKSMLDVVGKRSIVFSPAYPDGRRTTINGVHHIDGQPVTEAFAGTGPVTPVQESHIPTLLTANTTLTVRHVPLRIVRGRNEELTAAFFAAQQAHIDVIVPDAASNEDLQSITHSMNKASMTQVCAGAAGLAQHLADTNKTSEKLPSFNRATRVAAIVGTPSHHTRDQVTQAIRKIDAKLVPTERNIGLAAAMRSARTAWQDRRPVIFDAVLPSTPMTSAELTDQLNLVQNLGSALKAETDDLNLILTGGDTAQAALQGLGVEALEIVGEIDWGVPVGRVCGSPFKGGSIVTKGGNMGSSTALVKAFQSLGNYPFLDNMSIGASHGS